MKVDVQDIYELTPLQEGMLFYQMNSKEGEYFVQVVYNCLKKVDVDKLKTALELLSIKHEVLRTIFVYEKVKKPVQAILKKRIPSCKEVDISSETDKETAFEVIREEDVKRGFNFSKDPLLRVTLVKLYENEVKMIWSIHHIIIDGWSNSILFNSFLDLYSRLINGEDKEKIYDEVKKFNDNSCKYGDYVRWLKSKDKRSGIEYWNNVLNGYEGDVSIKSNGLSTETEKPVILKERVISKNLLNALNNLVSRFGVTLNTCVEVAFGILLQMYNYTDDVVFGKVVSGRTPEVKGIEEVVGLFINTIPLRIQAKADSRVSEIIKAVYNQSIESTKYDYIGLSEIQESLPNKANFINTIIAFENYYVSEGEAAEKLFDIENGREQTNYDVTFGVNVGEDLMLNVMYAPDKFSEEEMERVLAQFEYILEQIAENPECNVGEIEVVTAEEKAQIINEFNNTDTEYPSDKTVAQLLEEIVEKYPNKEAISYGDIKITYDELNKRANKVAAKLREIGVKEDDFVAIITEKSIEMIVGVCAILKAGAAYIPIDPNYPEERNKFILEDCKPKVLIKTNCDISFETTVKVLDINDKGIQECSGENLSVVGDGRSLAYVIYTSGTTGKPKGALIENRSIIRLVRNTNYMEFTKDMILLQTGSMAFDASTFEVWGTLLNGGKLVLIDKDVLMNPELLKLNLISNNVNTLFMTTALFNQVVQEDVTVFDGLNYLLTGGERASESHINMLINHNSKIKLINAYGPTENTTFTTMYQIERIVENIPIGKPISNTKVYVLNGNRMCGIGMVGELCTTGEGVAKGYLNRDDLNNEKFVNNLYGEGKMYRTGDLVRWLPNGELEIIGRIDEQVKIRGFRIELLEIEKALKEISGVKNAAVIVRTTENGEKILNGYFQSEEDKDISWIKDKLRNRLPEYMVPSGLMQIDEIPVTTNGKVDKRALPEISMTGSSDYVPPRNEMESIIANIFKEILHLDKVSVYDNFFEIGGHSLRATKLVNRIEKETNKKIFIKDIFTNSTVEKISNMLLGKSNEEYEPIPVAKEKKYYKMSSVQKRVYFIHVMEQSTLYNMPQCLKIVGEVKKEKVEEVINQLISRHESLRTRFLVVNDEPVQEVCNEVKADFEYIENYEDDERKLVFSLVQPFNLEKPSQIRVRLIKRESYYLLFIDMHHIIGDGMSVSVFIEEFSKLYNDEKLENGVRQYKDYSEWINKRDLNKQAQYWMDLYKDEVPILNLPTDFKRPVHQSFKGNYITKFVSNKCVNKIKAVAKKYGVTEYMVCLSALMILLGKYSNKEDIVVGTPISGRTHKDTERMIGMFVNTLVLRGKPMLNKSFEQFLKEIKDVCLKSYENQEYPFEELVEALEIEKDTSRNPMFDVMFAFQNNDVQKFNLGELEVNRVDFESNISKFDLTFNVNENEGAYEIDLEYCTDLFKEKTIELILEHYIYILEQVAEDSKMVISDISTATEIEKEQILNIFNNTETNYPKNMSVMGVFESQVSLNKDKVAVVFNEDTLTYKELNNEANKVASKLIDSGIGKGDFVAVFSEKSVEMVIAICGILKADAAYVPIDSNYPLDRINVILEDCKPKAIISCNEKIKFETDIEELNIKEYLKLTEEYKNFSRTSQADDIAYSIYTSGTTGKPKGTLIRNRSIVRLVKNTNYIDLNTDSVIMQTGSMAFDASTFEVWGALLNGGRLVLADEDTIMSSEKIKEYIYKNSVNVMWMTAALFNQMIKTDVSLFDGLEYLLIGGEKLSDKHVRMLKNHNSKIKLINGYGPTENTTFTTTYEIENNFEFIPIGKPIANTKVYVLNQNSLCGLTVPGELCTAGDGVADGYLHNEELTNEKFVKNPFGEGLLYRTGDLVRWMVDGNIDYLGRIDDQVKIRGFRIELEEIKKVLMNIEDIEDAAVVVRENSEGEKYLNAYFVSNVKKDISEIKTCLKKQLADYMVPNGIMQIESMPLTSNGKLDRRSLPKIEFTSDKNYEAPRNEAEKVICTVFEEILNVDMVGINDNFFELGGDSIKAIRVVSRIRDRGYEITVKEIMRANSIRDMEVEKLNRADELAGDIEVSKYVKELINSDELDKDFRYKFTAYTGELSLEEANKVFKLLVAKHPMLRANISEGKLTIADLKDEDYEVNKKIENTLIEATLTTEKLVLSISSLIVDSASIEIIKEDIRDIVCKVKENNDVKLLSESLSYKDWIDMKDIDEGILNEEVIKWNDTLEEIKMLSKNINIEELDNRENVSKLLSFDIRESLEKANEKFNTNIRELLLSTMVLTIYECNSNKEKVSVFIKENQYRKEEYSRTVGNFEVVYPNVLKCTGDIATAIIDTKEEVRKDIDKVSLNKVEKFDKDVICNTFFSYSEEESLEFNDQYKIINGFESNTYRSEVNFNFYVNSDGIEIDISCNKNNYLNKNVNEILNLYEEKLNEVINYCNTSEENFKTISDFTTSDLSTDDLDIINSLF